MTDRQHIDPNKRFYRPCSSPTEHAPGTQGKVATMRARDDRGEEIWHDDDVDLERRVPWSLLLVRMESLLHGRKI